MVKISILPAKGKMSTDSTALYRLQGWYFYERRYYPKYGKKGRNYFSERYSLGDILDILLKNFEKLEVSEYCK